MLITTGPNTLNIKGGMEAWWHGSQFTMRIYVKKTYAIPQFLNRPKHCQAHKLGQLGDNH